jgi:hypothetical protein
MLQITNYEVPPHAVVSILLSLPPFLRFESSLTVDAGFICDTAPRTAW